MTSTLTTSASNTSASNTIAETPSTGSPSPDNLGAMGPRAAPANGSEMIGHHCSRHSAFEPASELDPGMRGGTLACPSRFMAKPEAVRAVWHDGSDAQAALVTEWVRRIGDNREMDDREVRIEVEPGPVVVIQPAWPAEPVRLEPGMFLVLRSTGWTVYSAEQFLAAFEPLPRELPIFDDGEVA